MKVPFVKMHGAGNDFIVIDEFSGQLIADRDKPAVIAKYCRRHYGVGADGVIFVQKSTSADARFVFYNPDGSRAEMCGNGIRCFAKYVYDRGLVKKQNMSVDTTAGVKNVEVFLTDGRVSSAKVDMGVPGIEFTAKEIEVSGIINKITSISMGNPHAIVFVDDVDEVDVVSVGRRLRNQNELFPRGTNVHFVQKMKDNDFRIRTYERGVEDETLACGTGICASAVAAVLDELADGSRPIVFHARGGKLIIDLKNDFANTKRVYMTGPAEEVFSGELDV
jgi:diaminopimelate epimerase